MVGLQGPERSFPTQKLFYESITNASPQFQAAATPRRHLMKVMVGGVNEEPKRVICFPKGSLGVRKAGRKDDRQATQSHRQCISESRNRPCPKLSTRLRLETNPPPAPQNEQTQKQKEGERKGQGKTRTSNSTSSTPLPPHCQSLSLVPHRNTFWYSQQNGEMSSVWGCLFGSLFPLLER